MSNDPSDQYSALAVASSSEDEARQAALKFIENCGIAMVGSNGPDGYPLIKAMIKAESEELHTVWFSTNTSSARVAQFRADPRASIYFVDMSEYRGLLLVGTMEVLSDHASRERLWRYGNELYYPAGIDDPDYSVLKFTARRGNYYHGLRNTDFAV
ncbi:MAG: pyridoxamine 5'-phosphate oxidase family protein [Micromonosporaceae bacterium]|nr:pyridoxamine 5'-phosphate oxidase family protein [Micromonosporaceae bacterium]